MLSMACIDGPAKLDHNGYIHQHLRIDKQNPNAKDVRGGEVNHTCK